MALNHINPEIFVPVDSVHATQMEIGKAHVLYSIEKIKKRDPNLLKALLTRTLPGIKDPNGEVWITDGHHWAAASQTCALQNPDLAQQMQLKISLIKDFTGQPRSVMASFLYQQGIGYFSVNIREHFGLGNEQSKHSISAEKLTEMYFTYLGKKPMDLPNNPGRAIVGLALEKMGIVAENDLIDYIEFYMAEQFVDHFIEKKIDFNQFQDPALITNDLLKQVMIIMVTESRMISYLLQHTRPGVNKQEACAHLLGVINRYRKSLELDPL